jgi:serine/threonine protein kinase
MHTTCGTLNYIAPEIIKNTGYDGHLADIWACGVILYFMLTGRRPFDDESVHKLLDKIIIGEFKFPPVEVKYLSEDVKELIKSILTPNPKKRFTIE